LRGSDIVKKLLNVSPTTGDVIVDGRIDRETVEWLNFTVKATDSGVPTRSSYVDVSIRVVDQNDNAPEFREPSMNITVREDTPPGTVIAVLTADDLDAGEFGKVRFETNLKVRTIVYKNE